MSRPEEMPVHRLTAPVSGREVVVEGIHLSLVKWDLLPVGDPQRNKWDAYVFAGEPFTASWDSKVMLVAWLRTPEARSALFEYYALNLLSSPRLRDQGSASLPDEVLPRFASWVSHVYSCADCRSVECDHMPADCCPEGREIFAQTLSPEPFHPATHASELPSYASRGLTPPTFSEV